VAVPGFYDEVIPLEPWEREAWARLPFGDAQILTATGSPAIAGEVGFTTTERLWGRPTAEVNGLSSGFQGVGTKTVLPSLAMAKLTFRLVPGQTPSVILEQVSAHLRSLCPPGVSLELLGGHSGEPYATDPHSSDGQAAQRALQEVFPDNDLAIIREGGSIPIVNTFKRILGADTLLLGLALPDSRMHAPNENFPLAHLDAGCRLNRALLVQLA